MDGVLVGAGSLWPLVFITLCFPLFGALFACLVFGPRSLFLFLTCSWVLCFLKVWLGFIISTFVWVVTPIQFSRLIENESPLKTALQKSPCNRPQGPPSVWLLPSWSHYSVVTSVVWLSPFSYKNCCFTFFPTPERINLILFNNNKNPLTITNQGIIFFNKINQPSSQTRQLS